MLRRRGERENIPELLRIRSLSLCNSSGVLLLRRVKPTKCHPLTSSYCMLRIILAGCGEGKKEGRGRHGRKRHRDSQRQRGACQRKRGIEREGGSERERERGRERGREGGEKPQKPKL